MLFKYKIAFILAKKKVRYFIYFSYNGKSYHGWQKQKNSVTVQEKIEESLSVLLKGWIGITYFIRGEFYREKAKDFTRNPFIFF